MLGQGRELHDIIEEHTHALGAVANALQMRLSGGGQVGLVVFLQEPRKLADRVDGFAQVVRGHVDELLQALVGLLQ